MSAEPIWDYDVIAESFGGELSPLTYTFTREFFSAAATHTARIAGIHRSVWERSDIADTTVGYSHRHLFLNRRASYQLAALIPGYRAFPRLVCKLMFVPADQAEPAPSRSRVVDAARFGVFVVGLIGRAATVPSSPSRFNPRIDTALLAAAADAVDRSGTSQADAAELARLVDRLHQLMKVTDLWSLAIVNDFACQWSQIALARLLNRRRLQLESINGLAGALTTDQQRRQGSSTDLLNIAELICGEPALARSVVQAEAGAALSVLARSQSPGAQVAQDRLDQWLAAWGDSALSELKLEAPSFSRRPELFGALIKSAVVGELQRRSPSHEAIVGVPDATVSAAAAIAEAARRLRWRPARALQLRLVARSARLRLRDRERIRGGRARVYAQARVLCWAIGDQLVATGLIDEAADVFELELVEVFQLPDGRLSRQDIAALVTERRPDDVVSGTMAEKPRADVRDAAQSAERALEVRGQGCSAGTVTGRVRIVTRPEQVLELGEDAIIVCSNTDPGWTPVFASCTAILTERGNLLGHTAVVAREFAIPAVIGIRGLLDWARDGELVRVDGAAGIVTRIG
ncbi:MAG: hypothetical protein H7123_01360 [Thermoleophilia bacterium]|nr:hypothetical protein [Thermoleophilia bacterium]